MRQGFYSGTAALSWLACGISLVACWTESADGAIAALGSVVGFGLLGGTCLVAEFLSDITARLAVSQARLPVKTRDSSSELTSQSR